MNFDQTTVSLFDEINVLLKQQKADWELLRDNYSKLNYIEAKQFEFDDFFIKVQYNPQRIKSTAAKLDADSVSNRKCFLCRANLPHEQKGLSYKDEYTILCNPYPILPEHFTIVANQHLPQAISGNMRTMLNLCRDLSPFVVFYNGPQAGASAPDHLHFQAGNRDFLPTINEYETIRKNKGRKIFCDAEINIFAVNKYLRSFVAFESSSCDLLVSYFDKLFVQMKIILPETPEPRMNIICEYRSGKWVVIIFPREKFRPDQYFATDDTNLLISPAAVEFGGVVVTPRKDDFDKLNKNILLDIFNQVSVTETVFKQLINFVS